MFQSLGRTTFAALVVVAASLTPWATASAATSWDLAGDYAENTNPNGAWTYGQLISGTFSALAWHAPTSSYGIKAEFETFIYKNTGPFAFGIDPGKVSLESDWGNAAVRWTAPSAGDYVFTIGVGGTLLPDAGGGLGNNFAQFAGVRVNGVDQTSASFVDNVKAWSFTASLSAGETVDTFVLNPGSAFAGNTQTEISISAVPEPASALLLGLGLAAVTLRARRGRAQPPRD